MFIIYFVLASVITTLIRTFVPSDSEILAVADSIFSFLKNMSKFFIIMAMSAIGMNTDIVKLIKTGGKPILLGLCCWTAITGVSLIMQKVIRIW